ncbi:ORF MSV147 hypothetical protein [Melanoplus sanguinipes entomopoxvirus]|uniref:Uncharacterized protein n=1 Tax=Melanoplus sanguinipes entomopoxvirus TaxID=83191 RepID=Q9YVU5_MSEPV|nr:ORF MSV147 hypothetical protein [Melanoplus sanguinipes entomopoxvirus]AAC97787.1 ORF MSV147 hypothetical protein [Melanoplus sanguinipes entomopoxvirus 'O']
MIVYSLVYICFNLLQFTIVKYDSLGKLIFVKFLLNNKYILALLTILLIFIFVNFDSIIDNVVIEFGKSNFIFFLIVNPNECKLYKFFITSLIFISTSIIIHLFND